MAKTSKKIVQDLLKEANYYWHDENEDNIKPLNPEEYDPVVDKIFKANALELEKLYKEIEESQDEIILNLSQSLVPDLSMLPEPGYTVAQIAPKASRVSTNPEDQYQITGQSDTGEKYEYYFSPLFEHDYPECSIKAIITDNSAIIVEGNQPSLVRETAGTKAISTIWLGLAIGKLKENEMLSFYLGNRIVDEFDKNHYIFNSSKWLLDGMPEKELKVNKGIEGFQRGNSGQKGLLEILEVPNTHEKQIFSRLRKSFIHVFIPESANYNKREFPPQLANLDLVSEIKIKEPLCWIKIELPLTVPNNFLLENILFPNCIPLVNRRLQSKHVVKSNYDRILLPMPTTNYFLDVHKIQDAKNKEDDTTYQRVDFLHTDSRPGTYTLRSGSRVRRLNREDASRRIYRLLEVIQDEHSTFKEEGVNRLREDFEIIEKAINRVKTQIPDFFREDERKSSYFCIANFRPGTSRLQYQYWETQGNLIKHLGDKTGLEVTSSAVNLARSRSIIPIQHGKGELSPDDYINQLKISLLSRGRIMSKGDIELYCKSRYGSLLEVQKINMELMMQEDGERGRGLLVTAKITSFITQEEAELIRVELQNDLNAKSAFFNLIKVEFKRDA
jgi:hypothetical protein